MQIWRRTSSVLGAVALVGVMASACGGSGPSETTTAMLSSLTLSSMTVQSPNPVQGTVGLTRAASSGATVVLATSNASVATVPASVAIPPGASTGNFTIGTVGPGTSTITASMGGESRSATLTVGAPLVANFTVTSTAVARFSNGTSMPAGTADICPIVAQGNDRTLACRFDGSSSTGSPVSYEWHYALSLEDKRPPASASPTFDPPPATCGTLGGASPQTSGGITFVLMTVELRVRDAQGNQSALRTRPDIRVIPGNNCYGF